jgi:hypothetical protein
MEKAKDITSDLKEEVKEVGGNLKEPTDWIVQAIVLAVCGSFVVVVLGILLLMLAII